MKISYKKLWLMLIEKEISKQTLREQCNIAANTMTRLNKGEKVSLDVLMKICAYLNCNIGDICDVILNEATIKEGT
ncbi:MAG: helix-turn-helix domain-containing protein [Christensenellales bacterium]|jgi:putative transcriptional regulator